MNDYYEKNAKEFIEGTINCDMSGLYEFFEKNLNNPKTILDIGFGSGRDSLYFKNKGYEVTSIDPTEEFCVNAKKMGLENVYQIKAQEMNFENEFDGIWACASLLHIPSNELNDVFKKCAKSLKKNGIMYASFKYGDFEGERDNRFFNDMNKDKLLTLIENTGLDIIEEEITEDVRPDKQTKWYNAQLEKNGNKIKKLYFYNMGNGDCTLCTDESDMKKEYNCLLVDCGKDNILKSFKGANHLSNKMNNSNENNLLISHFHTDHYNELKTIDKLIKKPLTNIYIPNYICNFGVVLSGLVLVSRKNKKAYNPIETIAINMLKLLGFQNYNNLYNTNVNVFLVRRGNVVSNNVSELEILAPLNNVNYDKQVKELITPNDFDILKKFEKDYKEILGYKDLDGKDPIKILYNEEKRNKINNLIGNLEEKDIKIDYKKIKKIFSNYHNRLSIVFHEYNKEENNVLFCGDTESQIMTTIKSSFKNKYKAIKVPHHGTISHFSKDIPNTEYILIPGGNKKDNVSEWISCKYYLKYRDDIGRKAIFVCSNNIGCSVKECCNKCNPNIAAGDVCGIEQRNSPNNEYEEIII